MFESALLNETCEFKQCRYTYYLGQSYKDAVMPAEAIGTFERRAQMVSTVRKFVLA